MLNFSFLPGGRLNTAASTLATSELRQWNAAEIKFARGRKKYELSNHLGNVLSVLSDRKLQDQHAQWVIGNMEGQFVADVRAYTDYYAFGWEMPGRSEAGYRYGFNGKEKDGETTWNDFGARMYDARVGRWMAVDVMTGKYPGLNPYHFSFNSPTIFNDSDGEDGRLTIKDDAATGVHQITLESTIHLVGKDAYLAGDVSELNFTHTVKVQDAQIEGKVWEVTIKVVYVQSPQVDAVMKSAGMADGLTMSGSAASVIPTSKHNELRQAGFKSGDNVMRIDMGTGYGSSSGHTSQGFFFSQIHPAVSFGAENPRQQVINIIRHETMHQLGYDERYVPGEVAGHEGFKSDYLSTDFAGFYPPKTLNPIHAVDLADFATSRLQAGELTSGVTKSINRYSLKIDDTQINSLGDDANTPEENKQKMSRVISD